MDPITITNYKQLPADKKLVCYSLAGQEDIERVLNRYPDAVAAYWKPRGKHKASMGVLAIEVKEGEG